MGRPIPRSLRRERAEPPTRSERERCAEGQRLSRPREGSIPVPVRLGIASVVEKGLVSAGRGSKRMSACT